MKRSVALLVATLVALVAPPLRASDHLDDPASSKYQVTDLSESTHFPPRILRDRSPSSAMFTQSFPPVTM